MSITKHDMRITNIQLDICKNLHITITCKNCGARKHTFCLAGDEVIYELHNRFHIPIKYITEVIKWMDEELTSPKMFINKLIEINKRV